MPAIKPWRWNNGGGERDRERNIERVKYNTFLDLEIDIKYNK